MKIFGRGNEFRFHDDSELPARFGPGWIIMQTTHPGIEGRVYEAQPDGTWLDVTTPEQEEEYADAIAKSELEKEVEFDRKLAYHLIVQEVYTYLLGGGGTAGPILEAMAVESGYSEATVAADVRTLLKNKVAKLGTEYGKIYKKWKDAQT